jgi:glutaredoxin-like protein NrdH
MALEHVPGKKSKKIVVYALSTCPWCRKTKNLLNELGVEYYFADVDLASDNEKQELITTVRKWNPASSFPTIVLDDKKCIVGFKESEIREALKQ